MDNDKEYIREKSKEIADSIPDDKLMNFLKELNEKKQELDNLDPDNSVIHKDGWQWFDTMIDKSLHEKFFLHRFKEAYMRLKTEEHFKKISKSQYKVVLELKNKLKEYYNEIQYEDAFDFAEALFELPYDFVDLVVKYIAQNKKIPKGFSVDSAEFTEYIGEVRRKKGDIAKQILKVAQGKSDVVDIKTIAKILNVGAFYKYTPLNAACLEYIMKFLNNNETKQELVRLYGEDFVDYIKEEIKKTEAYRKHIKLINSEKDKPFFDKNGYMNDDKEKGFETVLKRSKKEKKVKGADDEKQKTNDQQAEVGDSEEDDNNEEDGKDSDSKEEKDKDKSNNK